MVVVPQGSPLTALLGDETAAKRRAATWTAPTDESLQAELFAALAARAAALVDRQHAALEQIQQDEEDPRRLAGLYRLDHLAAQLRRTSNATLVLAGRATMRSVDRPAPLSELAWAAVSEVNGYQRVTVGAFPPLRLAPEMASDLVHLLGDLLESALAASPRAGTVWVRGMRSHSPNNTGVLLKVGDSGPVLSEAAIRGLNEMLGGGRANPADPRHVGFIVTRELARRHGFTVTFERRVSEGMVATIRLPD